MAAVEIVERTAERFLPSDAHDQRRDLVDMRYDSGRIDQHDAVFEALDNRFGLVLFVDQAVDVELFEPLQPLGHPVEFLNHQLQLRERLRAQALGRPATQTEAAQAGRELIERLGERRAEGPRQRGAEHQQQREAGGEFVGQPRAHPARAAIGAEHRGLIHLDQRVELRVQRGELGVAR